MKKITIIIFIISFLSSCATSVKPLGYKHQKYSIPQENQTVTKDIGDRIIMEGEEEITEAYRIIKKEKDFTVTYVKYPNVVGDVLPLSGEINNYLLYYNKDQHIPNVITGVAKNKKTGEIKPFGNSVNGFYVKDIEGFEVEKTIYTNPNCKRCFKQELIYNGKSGTGLKFIYREYIDDLARPSFFQELQYDLSDGNIIGFKGARIEIEKATNIDITYKILKTFD